MRRVIRPVERFVIGTLMGLLVMLLERRVAARLKSS
jgi:hypothetical protein